MAKATKPTKDETTERLKMADFPEGTAVTIVQPALNPGLVAGLSGLKGVVIRQTATPSLVVALDNPMMRKDVPKTVCATLVQVTKDNG